MIKYQFIYNRKNKFKKDGTALIQLQVYQNRNRKFVSTGITIEPKYWESKIFKVASSHPRSDEYNMILSDMNQQVESILRKAMLLEKKIGVEDVVALLAQKESNLFSDFIKKEIESDKRIKLKTKTDLFNTLNRLNEFKTEIKIQDVDYKLIVEFDNYLRGRGYSINTISKFHKNVKRFLNLAIKYRIISKDDYPYSNFRVKKESTVRESLSLIDIKNLESSHYTENTTNAIVKDMFLFACYTGLRISDVTRLKPTDCQCDEKGWTLEFKTFKSNKMAYLPIWSLFKEEEGKSKPEELLTKYFSEKNSLVFPNLSESKINRHLKEIAKEAGINKNVTFHMGRHTFGTIMASKIPLPTLQNLMQHSDIKTTMIYINMSSKMIDDSLGKVNWNN